MELRRDVLLEGCYISGEELNHRGGFTRWRSAGELEQEEAGAGHPAQVDQPRKIACKQSPYAV